MSTNDTMLLKAATTGDLATIQRTDPMDSATVQKLAIAAAGAAQIETLQHLLDRGASLAYGKGDEIIRAALDSPNRPQVLECLLANNLDPNFSLGYLGNALVSAARRGDHKLVKVMLKGGANPDKGSFGAGSERNALAIAARVKDVPLMKLLIDAGASVNGLGALQQAVREGHVDAVKYLLERGADPNDVFDDPISDMGTPLEEAKRAGNESIVKLLLDAGASASKGS